VTLSARAAARADQLAYRPARADEMETCAGIWRTSINDYIVRLGQPEMPEDVAPTVRLFTHLQSTDPNRFIVALSPDDRVVAFTSAAVREHLWYLAMLFVLPEYQAQGIGRRLIELAGPDERVTSRATATDTAQPISNALYASLGIVPRLPLLRLVGNVTSEDGLPPLPPGVEPIPFDAIEDQELLDAELERLDRSTLGIAHPEDHAFARSQGREGFLYRAGDGLPVGYGYAAPSGRVGPIAVDEPSLLAPIVAHVVRAVAPRGAFAVWLPGTVSDTVPALLRAGFRLDGFPLLLCWDQPFGDFARYVPISPGLL
jgi:GNAT superfamily N-acetyltransferase